MSIKRAVQSAFLDAGLTLEKEALNAFVAFVEERGAEQELIFSCWMQLSQVLASALISI